MKLEQLEFTHAFQVVLSTPHAQAAVMTIAPGRSSGGESVHGGEQWLFVLAGEGEAQVAGTRHALRPHSLVVIEADEAHEIFCTGAAPLETLNFYAPPEF